MCVVVSLHKHCPLFELPWTMLPRALRGSRHWLDLRQWHVADYSPPTSLLGGTTLLDESLTKSPYPHPRKMRPVPDDLRLPPLLVEFPCSVHAVIPGTHSPPPTIQRVTAEWSTFSPQAFLAINFKFPFPQRSSRRIPRLWGHSTPTKSPLCPG